MERAPTAPTSQPPAITTPRRGRPKPPEPQPRQADMGRQPKKRIEVNDFRPLFDRATRAKASALATGEASLPNATPIGKATRLGPYNEEEREAPSRKS
eukprot:scaffold74805_cov26-Tisochrysis_lutea.AAC.1